MLENYEKYLNLITNKIEGFLKNKNLIFSAKKGVQSAAKKANILGARLNLSLL